MGIELAKAYVRVRADSSSLGSDLQNSKKETEGPSEEIGKSMAESINKGFKSGLAGVLGGFGVFAKGFLSKGLAQAGQFEQTVIAFETMIGSAKETKETLADLTTFAAKTPFEMPEILQAARGLIQFGERGDDLMETLNLLGNAAAATSTPFGFLALVFNQIRGVGKLLTQDFRQLSTRGIISLQDIADHFDVTTAAAQKMLSAGQISFEDLKNIMRNLNSEGGRFFNLMERQSQSLLGLQSTLSDAWNIMARQLASALVPAVKAFVSIAVKAVDVLALLVENAQGVTSAALTASTAISLLGASLAAGTLLARIFGVSFSAMLLGGGVGVIVIGLAAAFGAVAKMIYDALDALVDFKFAFDQLQSGFDNIKEAFDIAFGGMREGLATLKRDFEDFAETIKIVIRGLVIWMGVEFLEWTKKVIAAAEIVAVVFRNFAQIAELAWNEVLHKVISFRIRLMEIWHAIKVDFIATFAAMGAFVKSWALNLLESLANIPKLMKQLMDGIREAAESPEKAGKILVQAMKGAQGLLEAPGDAQEEALRAAAKAMEVARDALGDAKTEKEKAALKFLEKERARILKEILDREAWRAAVKEDEEEEEAEEAPEEDTGKKKSGRFRVEEFQNVLQDSVLGDKQDMMITLLDAANVIAAEQLAESKKNKPGVLGP